MLIIYLYYLTLSNKYLYKNNLHILLKILLINNLHLLYIYYSNFY